MLDDRRWTWRASEDPGGGTLVRDEKVLILAGGVGGDGPQPEVVESVYEGRFFLLAVGGGAAYSGPDGPEVRGGGTSPTYASVELVRDVRGVQVGRGKLGAV